VAAPKLKARGTGIALVCMLAFSLSAFCASPLVSEATGELLANLVRTSLEYDLYNTRCRGNAASTKTDDSNRLLISKYKLTVNQVINLYIGKDYRAQRDGIEQAFLQKIGQMGGCKMAKKKGLLEDLDRRYRQLFEQISNMP